MPKKKKSGSAKRDSQGPAAPSGAAPAPLDIPAPWDEPVRRVAERAAEYLRWFTNHPPDPPSYENRPYPPVLYSGADMEPKAASTLKQCRLGWAAGDAATVAQNRGDFAAAARLHAMSYWHNENTTTFTESAHAAADIATCGHPLFTVLLTGCLLFNISHLVKDALSEAARFFLAVGKSLKRATDGDLAALNIPLSELSRSRLIASTIQKTSAAYAMRCRSPDTPQALRKRLWAASQAEMDKILTMYGNNEFSPEEIRTVVADTFHSRSKLGFALNGYSFEDARNDVLRSIELHDELYHGGVWDQFDYAYCMIVDRNLDEAEKYFKRADSMAAREERAFKGLFDIIKGDREKEVRRVLVGRTTNTVPYAPVISKVVPAAPVIVLTSDADLDLASVKMTSPQGKKLWKAYAAGFESHISEDFCGASPIVEALMYRSLDRAQMVLNSVKMLGDNAMRALLNTRIKSIKAPLVQLPILGYQWLTSVTEDTGEPIAFGDPPLRLVEMLIGVGCNVNGRDIIGATALHHACGNAGNPEIVEGLIRLGASVNALDRFGRTPLHIAVNDGAHTCLALLMANGGDENIADNEGQKIWQVADNMCSAVIANRGGEITKSRFCSTCMSTEHVSKCSGCGLTSYCSKDCQLKDWSAHKAACKAARASKPSATAVETGEKACVLGPVSDYLQCAACGKYKASQCGRCKGIAYCSKACQRSHWSTHKPACQELGAMSNWPFDMTLRTTNSSVEVEMMGQNTTFLKLKLDPAQSPAFGMFYIKYKEAANTGVPESSKFSVLYEDTVVYGPPKKGAVSAADRLAAVPDGKRMIVKVLFTESQGGTPALVYDKTENLQFLVLANQPAYHVLKKICREKGYLKKKTYHEAFVRMSEGCLLINAEPTVFQSW